jgi:hypothetical protein
MEKFCHRDGIPFAQIRALLAFGGSAKVRATIEVEGSREMKALHHKPPRARRDRHRSPVHRDRLPVRLGVGLMVAITIAATSSVATGPDDAELDRETGGVELQGNWYLLIHYREAGEAGDAEHEALEQWDERIWRFDFRRSSLRWTEYPVASFRDKRGRFEDLRGTRARTTGFWVPNAEQRGEIESGLGSTRDGSRVKNLRAGAERYSSGGELRAQSTSVIGYSETWTVAAVNGLPVFAMDALMGAGRTDLMEGRTQLTTTAIHAGGAELEGDYERDGSRRGRFRLFRTGPIEFDE